MTVSYEVAEQALASRLGDQGLSHSRAVAGTAALLASLYGEDVESARLAGLLHDWHRELPHDELVESAARSGIEVTEADLEVPYLLHARTGAVDVEEEFPDLPREVVLAVHRHTLGSPDMSGLDKIVYVADMIEPNRSYPGVDDLREMAGTLSLDDLFANAYARSVRHLVDSRKRIHPDTIAVWNALVAKDQR